jgi:hypothetical protein
MEEKPALAGFSKRAAAKHCICAAFSSISFEILRTEAGGLGALVDRPLTRQPRWWWAAGGVHP